MFAYVCGGRPIETNIKQVEPTKFVFTIPDASRINYIALFLLPGATLPDEYAAAVYVQLPNTEEFQLLGALSAAKQSAIFKLNMGTANSAVNDVDEMIDDDEDVAQTQNTAMTFGISIEAAPLVEQYLAQQKMAAKRPKSISAAPPGTASSPAPAKPEDVATLGNKIVRNVYNYLASFIDSQGRVPIKAFDDWWNKFRTRLAADPNFLKSLPTE